MLEYILKVFELIFTVGLPSDITVLHLFLLLSSLYLESLFFPSKSNMHVLIHVSRYLDQKSLK